MSSIMTGQRAVIILFIEIGAILFTEYTVNFLTPEKC